MITSDIDKALKGAIPWTDFCDKYSEEKNKYLSRNDGVLTSSDFNMKFDLQEATVKEFGLFRICLAALEGSIDIYDVSFIANAILLSGFYFENDDLENVCHSLSNLERLEELEEVKSTL